MNPQPIISKDQMAKLLGRSLTSVEDTNYQLYLPRIRRKRSAAPARQRLMLLAKVPSGVFSNRDKSLYGAVTMPPMPESSKFKVSYSAWRRS